MRAATALATVTLWAAAVSAQTLGSLTGVVRDPSDAVLPGANVALVNEATGARQDAVTNDIGAFTFAQLPVGTYRVTISLQGFQTRAYNQIVINVGQEYALAARLTLGTLTEAVQVIAGASLVRTTTPEVSATVFQDQILNIPWPTATSRT
jgi:hypothetical protein